MTDRNKVEAGIEGADLRPQLGDKTRAIIERFAGVEGFARSAHPDDTSGEYEVNFVAAVDWIYVQTQNPEFSVADREVLIWRILTQTQIFNEKDGLVFVDQLPTSESEEERSRRLTRECTCLRRYINALVRLRNYGIVCGAEDTRVGLLESQCREVLLQLPVAIWRLDRDLNVVDLNELALGLSGATRDELVFQPIVCRHSEDVRQEVIDVCTQVKITKEMMQLQVRLSLPGTPEELFILSIQPVQDGGLVVSGIGIIDLMRQVGLLTVRARELGISEEVLVALLLTMGTGRHGGSGDQLATLAGNLDRLGRLKVLADLAARYAAILHDVNNHLTALGGNLDLARSGLQRLRENNELLEFLQKHGLLEIFLQAIEDQETARKSFVLIRSAVSLHQESLRGIQRQEKKFVTMKDVVRGGLISITRLQRTGVELRVIEDDDPPTIMAVAGLLEQVVVNLVKNAIEAIPKEQETKVVTIHTGHDGEAVWISVEDNGPGVPHDFEDSLFLAFATSKGDEGTGLGLWSSRDIVEQLGGTISYEPVVPTGSRFTVRLPIMTSNLGKEPVVRDGP